MNDIQKTEIRVESQDEAKDTSGPRGTYGCACLDRYWPWQSPLPACNRGACTCVCHKWSDDDDEYH